MSLNEVARRLGMILSPAQEIYRESRKAGVDKLTARQLALEGARARAMNETQAVLTFLHRHAVWTIPDAAWPSGAC